MVIFIGLHPLTRTHQRKSLDDNIHTRKYADQNSPSKVCQSREEINISDHVFVVILELSHMCGVAAILRFPLPELDNLSQSDDDDDEDDEMEFA